MSNKSKKNKKFNSLGSFIERDANKRTERQVEEEKPLMLFSFKDFQFNRQIPPGQNYAHWQEAGLLSYLLDKFGHICNCNRIEAEQQKFIKVYGDFPSNSEFENPFPESEVDWAVIMRISGQKGRVAGYVIGHIFYVVFLDSEHRFFPSNRK